MIKVHAQIQKIFSGGDHLQTRGGPTNFTIAKTHMFENRGGQNPLSLPPLDPPMKLKDILTSSVLSHSRRKMLTQSDLSYVLSKKLLNPFSETYILICMKVNFCCNHPKIQIKMYFHEEICQKSEDGMTNSVDPDQTAPL